MSSCSTANGDGRWLKIPEVSDRTGLSRTTIYRLIRSGDLPSFKVGGSRRISSAALDLLRAEGESA